MKSGLQRRRWVGIEPCGAVVPPVHPQTAFVLDDESAEFKMGKVRLPSTLRVEPELALHRRAVDELPEEKEAVFELGG